MKTTFIGLRSPAIISFLFMLPFAVLEFIFNTVTRQNVPGLIVLFSSLWVLPLVFIAIIIPIVRDVRAGKSVLSNPVSLFLKVTFLVFVAFVWGSILIDQMPCFLGVPNCD